MEKKLIRNSNYELLRIIAMFFIVLFHVIFHGHIIENSTNYGLSILVLLIEYITLVHVNSFVLVTGYFQSKSTFKSSKIWKLVNASLFYTVVTILIFSFFDVIHLSKVEWMKQLSLLHYDQYWFIKIYIFLYCISPFLNKLIDNLKRKEHLKMLGVLFLIFSIIPFITGSQGFDNNGFTLYNFIFLYLLGAYLRKYPIEKNYFFKRFSKPLLRIILFAIFCFCVLMNFTLYVSFYSFRNINSIFLEFYNNISKMKFLYSNPFIIIQSVAFFLFFGTLNIKSKKINKISSLMLGVYLAHDHHYTHLYIYKWLKIETTKPLHYSFLFYIFFVAIMIFIICIIIEFLRQCLFRFIYNRKIVQKIRNRYYRFIHNLYIVKQ